MDDKNRTEILRVRVSRGEKDLILQRMRQAGITNLSGYTRQMLINGQIIRRDFKELKSLTAQIGRIGSNINQIAKRANEARTVSQDEIKFTQKLLQKVYWILSKEVGKVLN